MRISNQLQIGKAGEYLTCADLIINGYIAFPSEQGLPYDLILSVDDNLYKVQVKTTQKSKNIPQRKTDIPAYIFHIGYNGKDRRRKKYKTDDVDLFALVALDTKRVAYLPNKNIPSTINLRVPEWRGKYHDEIAIPNKKAVLEYRKDGKPLKWIAEKMSLKLSSIYRYTSNVSLEQKGTNSGVYFDDLTLERCLNGL